MAFNHGSAFAVVIYIVPAPSVRDGAAAVAVHLAGTSSFAQDLQPLPIVHDNGPLSDRQPDHRHSEFHACVVHLRPLCPLPAGHPAPTVDDNGSRHLRNSRHT